MFRSHRTLRALADVRQRVDEIQIAEEHGAVLTLTRTSTQAITTAGTTITWQSELRNFQFTWSGTTITMPADGWYAIDLSFRFLATLNNFRVALVVNGTAVKGYNLIGDVDANNRAVSMMRYFAAGDAVTFLAIPSANTDILVNAENTLTESPILNIVQLSGGIG